MSNMMLSKLLDCRDRVCSKLLHAAVPLGEEHGKVAFALLSSAKHSHADVLL